MLRLWCPAFVRATVTAELAVLIATEPKFNDAGLETTPASALTDPTTPAQPVRYTTIRLNTNEHTNPVWVLFVIFPSAAEIAPGPEQEPERGE